MTKFAYAPNGSPILGTLETLTGRAEIKDGSFRNEDGAEVPEDQLVLEDKERGQ